MLDMSIGTKRYILTLSLLAVFLIAFLTFSGKISWHAVLFFGVLIFLSELLVVELPHGGAVSVSFALLYSAFLLFGPASAVLAALFTTVTWRDIKRKARWYDLLFNGSQYVIATGLSALVYLYTGGHLISDGGFSTRDFPRIIGPLLLSASTFLLLNTGLVSISFALDREASPFDTWLVNARGTIGSYFALAAFGVIMAQVYVLTGPAGTVLLIAPLLVARQVFQRYMKLRRIYGSSVMSLVKAVEVKDPYTRGHSDRVAQYSEMMARELGWREDKIERLKFAGYLHDIGKIGIPKKILNKPGRLTDKEYERVKGHTELGVSILREIDFLRDMIPIILYHHEHLDTKGYPKGLPAEEIPEGAKILAVADSYDAMTSARAYRPPMPREEAIAELRRCSGTQFDQKIVEVFIKALNERGKDIGKGQPRSLKEQEAVV